MDHRLMRRLKKGSYGFSDMGKRTEIQMLMEEATANLVQM
jgi:hypothetical protein